MQALQSLLAGVLASSQLSLPWTMDKNKGNLTVDAEYHGTVVIGQLLPLDCWSSSLNHSSVTFNLIIGSLLSPQLLLGWLV